MTLKAEISYIHIHFLGLTLPMSKMRVLIVDDEPEILKIVVRYFGHRSEYSLFTASGPRQALEIVRKEPPFDLLISDVEMPDMRGPVLLHEIKRISPEIRCILMSGHVKDPVNFPIDVPFLPKPFRAGELFSAIEEVLPFLNA